MKTSMATFLNAFTANDWTMYPFASQVEQDFNNILSIYCDAVFRPLSMKDPKPFLQEGWHLEMLSKDDIPSYNGVVYNEMKGAMSSVDRILQQATLEAMYKDSFYGYNSGGDPDVIPSLTYEDYKAFYHKHYTPQNAMTYFYGKMDIEAKLKWLDEEYFSHYTKTDEEIEVNNGNILGIYNEGNLLINGKIEKSSYRLKNKNHLSAVILSKNMNLVKERAKKIILICLYAMV